MSRLDVQKENTTLKRQVSFSAMTSNKIVADFYLFSSECNLRSDKSAWILVEMYAEAPLSELGDTDLFCGVETGVSFRSGIGWRLQSTSVPSQSHGAGVAKLNNVAQLPQNNLKQVE